MMQPAKRFSKWKHEWKMMKRQRSLLVMSAPAILFKLIFSYLPLIGLVIAFKSYRYDLGIFGSDWNGFNNFTFFFTSQTAWIITRNTVLYNGAFILLTTVCALLLAILLREIMGRRIQMYQTVLFLPHLLSWVVVGYIALAIFEPGKGLLHQLALSMGEQPVAWYQESKWWPLILPLFHIWKSVGLSALIYFAGILGIHPSYYEAAQIDGASKWHLATKITIPMLMPLVVILFLVAVGGIFRADFGLFYFIPNDSSFLYSTTDVIDTYVYRSLKNIGDIGMTAAVGLYQSVVGFVLVISANALVRRINRDNAMW